MALTVSSLFASLTPGQVAALKKECEILKYPKHTLIVKEDELSDSLYWIESGKVKVYVSGEDGREVVLTTHSEGDYFGEMAMIDSKVRAASVITVEPSTIVVMGKEAFQKVQLDHPDIAWALIRGLIIRLRELTDNVKMLALKDVYQRVVRILEQLAVPEGTRRCVKERLTQQELANRVGASREMVSRVMKELVKGNYISIEERQIFINCKLPAKF